MIPTDTIYGIVARAEDRVAVGNLYKIRRKSNDKPLIILISSISDLERFSIDPGYYSKVFDKYWPGPVSIILPCNDRKLEYLHLGTNSLAFRLPNNKVLQELVTQTGPLVAPSANLPGQPPAINIETAKNYFGTKVSYYLDGGEIHGEPSKIVSLLGAKERYLRT